MQERGVCVDHSSISRWAIKFLPLLEKVFRKHKRAVGVSWRMDETADAHDPQRPNEQRKSNGTFVRQAVLCTGSISASGANARLKNLPKFYP